MISAIILTRNSERYIKKCLDCLKTSILKTGQGLEIFIIDNGSKDRTLKILEEIQEKNDFINLIKLNSNKGTTYSRNLGIQKSKGEYILIIDSDLELKEDTLQKLINRMNNSEATGIICPKLLYPSGKLQYSFKKFPTLQAKILKILSFYFNYFKKFADKSELYGEKKEEFFPDYCISACWLVPKVIFNKVGLFDEKIFYSPEDVDYCLRVWLGGYRIYYFPAVEAIHHAQRISYKKNEFKFIHIKGLFYYFLKHKYLFSRRKIYKKISNSLGRKYPLLN